MSDEVPEETLEQNATKICKDSGIDVNPLIFEGCHRLSIGRDATNSSKRVIVKFVNRKQSELCVSMKRTARKVSLLVC